MTDVSGETSDGHHTFNELYEHRHALFALACQIFDGWKSKLHDDGTMFDGWFIAGVETTTGQATYHVPMSWWERYNIQEFDRAPQWDGHTSADVLDRLQVLGTSMQQKRHGEKTAAQLRYRGNETSENATKEDEIGMTPIMHAIDNAIEQAVSDGSTAVREKRHKGFD